jgi:hypothetical protein
MGPCYAPLAAHLAGQPGPFCERTLGELDALLAPGGLPPTARRSRRWWRSARAHRHARDGWLAAGWRVADADLRAGIVTFIRVPAGRAGRGGA